MTRLSETFATLKKQGRKALFIYLMAGAPDIKTTIEAVLAAEKAGADVIELGVPFSDPIADGPVIQAAGVTSLKNGVKMKHIIDMVKSLRQVTQIPLIGMGYINTMLNFGVKKFIEEFQAVGLDGLIIPDLPHEESAEIMQFCQSRDFHLAEFITPNTTVERMKETCKSANGFIYCVSVNGVTGVRKLDYTPIHEVMKIARQQTDIPLMIGFGIGNGAAAKEASRYGDGVIVGSAVVQKIADHDIAGACQLISSIRQALDEGVD